MRRLLPWLLVACLAVVLCPEAPHEFGPGYDRSFLLGLNAAHAQSIVFGERFIYPYGPLGWLCQPLPVSGALGAAFAAKCALFALCLSALVLLARRIEGRGLRLWCLAVIGLAGLADPLALWLSHLDFALPVLGLLAWSSAPARRLPALLAMAAAAAALLLVKVDAGVYAAVLCAGLALATACALRADARAVLRLLLLPPAAFAAALVALFVLAPGRAGALPGFLAWSLRGMAGYKEMSVDGPPGSWALMLAALVAALAVLPLLVRDRRRLAPALLVIALPAALLWLRVVMRQDAGHQVSFLPRLAVLLLFPLLALATARDRLAAGALQALVLATGLIFVERTYPEHHAELLARVTGRRALHTVAAVRDWDATRRQLEAEGELLGAPLRLGEPARAIVGDATVDAVPWNLERVMAEGWRWQPRPVMQDPNAYAPPLDRLNALHLAGGEAPRFVLADVFTIDGRHVFLEAPLGWRELLGRYDLRASFPGVLLLERRPACRFDPPRVLAELDARWDEELRVPASGEFVLLSCRIAPTAAGRVAGLVYRNTPVLLDVRYRSGFEHRWRAVRPNLESGVLVSQMPTNVAGLGALFASGPGDAESVESVRLHTDAAWQYPPSIRVTWWELPRAAGERPWRGAPPAPDAAATGRWRTLGDGCLAPGRPVLRLHGDARPGQPLDLVVEGAHPLAPVRILVGAEAVERRRAGSALYVDPVRALWLATFADEAGVARVRLELPAAPGLAGAPVTLQAAAANVPGEAPAWVLGCGLQGAIGG